MELAHWFDGSALMRISPFLMRKDHENALGEAVEKLKKHYGGHRRHAEDMLHHVLDNEKIDLKDPNAIAKFTAELVYIYYSAVQTKRDATFNSQALIMRIIECKLPYLRKEWALNVYRASCEGKEIIEFKEFLDFLDGQERFVRTLIDCGCDISDAYKSEYED